MNEQQKQARLQKWQEVESPFYRRWRVYSTFLTGFAIGLFYVLLISGDAFAWLWSESQAKEGQYALVLIFSGILGGVIYTILIDGHVEMPQFIKNRGDRFRAGLFGDILLGIAGAIVLDYIVKQLNIPLEPGVEVAAAGIVGGYGGRAILQFALQRVFKDINLLEPERIASLQANLQRRLERVDSLTLIDLVNQQIKVGLPSSELGELSTELERAESGVKKRVFDLVQDFRLAAKAAGEGDRIQRMIPIFEALIKGNANQHAYYAELAFAYKDSSSPDLFQAIQYLDKAISLRGSQQRAETWNYELSRSITRIQAAHQATGSYDFDPAVHERIIADLVAVANIYNLENILRATDDGTIPLPVLNWMEQNEAMLATHPEAKVLIEQMERLQEPATQTVLQEEPGQARRQPDAPRSQPNVVTESDQVQLRVPTEITTMVPLTHLSADAIRWVKAQLMRGGFYADTIDDVLDTVLMEAYAAFQTAFSLKEKDMIDPRTIQLLADLEQLDKDDSDIRLSKPTTTGEKLPPEVAELNHYYESCRLKAYPDPGTGKEPITIGWGSTFYQDGSTIRLGNVITQAEANELYDYVCYEKFWRVLASTIPHWAEMSNKQKAALCSFAYNNGAKFYKNGRHDTIARNLRERDWGAVPGSMMMYRNPGQNVEVGLGRRRRAEGLVWIGVEPASACSQAESEIKSPADCERYEQLLKLNPPSFRATTPSGTPPRLPSNITSQENLIGLWKPSRGVDAFTLPVNHYAQIDNTGGDGYRECFLTSCTMLADYITHGSLSKERTEKGLSEPEDAYRLYMDGDTTIGDVHVKALKKIGIDAYFTTTASIEDVESSLYFGIPVPVGVGYKDSGHWVVVNGRGKGGWDILCPNGIREGKSDNWIQRFRNESEAKPDDFSWRLLDAVFADLGPENGYAIFVTAIDGISTGVKKGM